MPEYDATNYPKPMTDDLTDAEVGRDSATETLKAWPSSNVIPDQYAGAVPSREFESNNKKLLTATTVAPVPPPTEKPQQSAVPEPSQSLP